MPDTAEDLLLECLSQALERSAFMSLEEPAPGQRLPEGIDHYRVRFTGAATGQLELLAPRELGAHIAANMLGVGVGDPQALLAAADALMELSNVTAGLLIQRQFADAPELPEMGLPEAVPDDDPLACGATGDVVCMPMAVVDGLPVALRVRGLR